MEETRPGGGCHKEGAPLHLWASIKWAKVSKISALQKLYHKGCLNGACDSNTIFKTKSII